MHPPRRGLRRGTRRPRTHRTPHTNRRPTRPVPAAADIPPTAAPPDPVTGVQLPVPTALPPTPAPAADPRDKLFDTSHLMADLKGRSVRGGAVTLGAQAIKFVLQLGSTAILARLLTPADFGLIAMVAVFTNFVGLFKDLGLSTATVQRERITHAQASTLFWINVALSVALAVIGCALAPAIVWFYGEERLFWVTVAMSCTFIFGGLSAQHTALLRRHMRYLATTAIEVSSFAVAALAAVAVAWQTHSYWALATLVGVQAFASCVGSWMMSEWRPGSPTTDADVGAMMRFGGSVSLTQMLNFVLRNADNLLLGWAWGSVTLGLYTRAYQLLMLPLNQAVAPITAVAMPVLSRLQNEPDRFVRFYRSGVRLVASLTMPIAAYMLLNAEVAVRVLLGEGWSDAVPIFQLLAAAGIVESLNVTHAWLFMPLGRGRQLVRCAFFRTAIVLAAFGISLRWGAVGIAAAFAASRLLTRPFELWYASKGTPARVRDTLGAVLPAGVATGSAFLACFLLTRILSPQCTSTTTDVAQLVAFPPIYLATWLLWRSNRSLVQSLLMRRFANA